jgi:rSAM/selenodomain-associated transferase 1
MVKAPVAGRAKTRLAREIGVGAAVGFYRHATAGLLARVGRDPRWLTLLAVTPDTAIAGRDWPARLPRFGQGGGDLGQRMQAILDRTPPGPTLVIGSDLPGVTPAVIAKAFRLLGRHDIVYGPARDGGFWLVGHAKRRPVPPLFQGVPWSSPDTLAAALANIAHCRVGLTATLADVDDAGDLARSGGRGSRRVPPVGTRET